MSSKSKAIRPSDDAIVLAMLLRGRPWMASDEVRHALVELGFAVTSQQVAAWLRRLSLEDGPMVKAKDQWGYKEYAVTRYGVTQIQNHWDGASREWREAP